MSGGDPSSAIRVHAEPPEADSARCSLDGLLRDAAAQITRFDAPAAAAACAADAVMIDIRSNDARQIHGIVPGSLHIPRTVLEWRVALESPWRNRYLGGRDQRLILLCDHGYSSVLAASNLVALGFDHAGDVIGGFVSWRAHDLAIAPCPSGADRGSPGLPGTGPPELTEAGCDRVGSSVVGL